MKLRLFPLPDVSQRASVHLTKILYLFESTKQRLVRYANRRNSRHDPVLFSPFPLPSVTVYSDGVKCRGGPPCDYCLINDVDCRTNELSDMRRKGAMERKIEQLEDAEHLLLDLVQILKQDDQNVHTCQLINLIRSSTSLGEIRFSLGQQFSLEALERIPRVSETHNHLAQILKEESYARPRRRMMTIQRLADIPIYHVPAKPWTTVTDDDDLVSHLISIWLTWSHPWFCWVNRDLFIQDMQAGNLDCEFCSPFLVNSILAETSVCKHDCLVNRYDGD